MSPRIPASAPALDVVVRCIRPLHRQILRVREGQLAGSGVSVPLRAVLERLYEAGPQAVPALARSLDVPRQFVLRLVGEAEGLGYAERIDNPAHRRSGLVRLTATGRGAVEEMIAQEGDLIGRIAARFDADDVEAASRVLAGLTAALAAERAAAAPPTEGADEG
jgi:DNA-binding MarR family transcriptional regulator